MNLDFLTVLVKIGVLILLAVPGYILRKIKVLDSGGAKPLVLLLIYVTQPFIIIMSFQGRQYSPDILGGMLWVFLFSAAFIILTLFAAKLIFDRFKISKGEKGVYAFATAFSNCGYMGIPVINALFAESANLPEMLIYVSVYIAVFNIVNWTVGIYFISGDRKYMSLKNAFINPAMISIAIALPLFFFGVSIKSFSGDLASAFSMLGDMTTPVSMIIIGIKLAEMPLKKVFSSTLVYLCAFIKLLAAPLILLLALKLVGVVPNLAVTVLIIISAMPTAALTVVNAERFGGDSLAATKAMLLSTLLSVLTIPLVCLFL